jgi:Leucine-rich repeat (LRR) protein
LKGLEKNFRIKHIFVQNNKIKSIDGIFDILKHIETLVLYDNELRDLDNIIKNVKVLTSLRHIDLFDNPAAHEPNYKMRVLNDLQQLEILDRHKVSIVEKDEAVKFMSQVKGKKKNLRPFAW